MAYFEKLEGIIKSNGYTIDRPKGKSHPRFPELIYPIDYGYINGTQSQDGQGIDLFLGTGDNLGVVGIICAFDDVKHDSEIKVLYNCTEDDITTAMKMMSHSPMTGLLVRRK